MLSTIRTFLSRFVGPYADDASLEDLQLVVAEACVGMRSGGVDVQIELNDGVCLVQCGGVEQRADAGEMRARLLEALAPDADWFHDDTGHAGLRFSVSLSS
jgi:hypothetical protein